MIAPGTLVAFSDDRSSTRVGLVTGLAGEVATVHTRTTQHTRRRADLRSVRVALAALDRAREVGRPVGSALLVIGHADTIAAYVQWLERGGKAEGVE